MRGNYFFNYFRELAEKARKATNKEETIRIRNKLIKTGIVLLVIGLIGVFTCFVSFALIAFNNFKNFGGIDGFGKIFIPFFLIIPFGVMSSIGGTALYLGLGITVAKAATEFADTNRYCPYCGDLVTEDEYYCNKCGKPLLKNKVCKKCHTENDLNSSYCKNCGNKLD